MSHKRSTRFGQSVSVWFLTGVIISYITVKNEISNLLYNIIKLIQFRKIMEKKTKPLLLCLTRRSYWSLTVVLASMIVGACANKPLSPYSDDTPPLVLLPISQAGIEDQRGRFREIFCTVLEKRGTTLQDYRPCEEALTRVGIEPEGTGKDVALGASERELVVLLVQGVGWNCFRNWLDAQGTGRDHIRKYGYDISIANVDALSSTTNNARQIRDVIMAMELKSTQPKLVLLGYSKGAPDILEAVVAYPEIRKYIAAVVSATGAIGGSPLATDATQSQLEYLKHWPDADCTSGDGGAIESLLPATRQKWLAENTLPRDFPYYSLVTYPKPERISSGLESHYDDLSVVDARNDSQLISYNQIIPGSTLIGYLNADHWAVSVPIARTHPNIEYWFVDQNDYPREALLEAILRFVEEDLSKTIR